MSVDRASAAPGSTPCNVSIALASRNAAGEGTQLRTVEQAAAELAVSVHTIRAWIAKRKLGAVRLGRAVRVPATELALLNAARFRPSMTVAA